MNYISLGKLFFIIAVIKIFLEVMTFRLFIKNFVVCIYAMIYALIDKRYSGYTCCFQKKKQHPFLDKWMFIFS